MNQLNKTQLRKIFLQQRRSLVVSEWQEKSYLICQQLRQLSLFQEATTILSYFSFRQEPDLSFLDNSQQKWGFPRCVGNSLIWHSWQPGDELQIGNYGIQEPCLDAPKISPQTVDLILVPTVACDRHGSRLGYGGGFYDRLLSSPLWLDIPTVGIVFDFAYIDKLPTDRWDIKLNYICTETRLDYC
ncbi:MAG: 5-formyltetrahydrofolate cyclo-ligase [Pleurocapsa sp.]